MGGAIGPGPPVSWGFPFGAWAMWTQYNHVELLEGSATIRAYRRTDYFAKWRELVKAWAEFVME